ncbi:hypothetical protein Tco_0842675 [Tanacetum coccineum]|uniref:Retrotransposon gag domain-containing protein n=1 Tax=Tanacetum coccineum TaxID=301880 RepID=A0ABQ5B164_9ASTR
MPPKRRTSKCSNGPNNNNNNKNPGALDLTMLNAVNHAVSTAWRTLKDVKGEGFVEALAWHDFLEVFYQHYFSYVDREAYIREYSTIRQKPNESITVFMKRFVRLAGIAGTRAGNAEEQARKFNWAIDLKYKRDLVNIRFEKILDVANAAKNLEMEHADYIASRPVYNRKSGREDHYRTSDRHGKFQPGNNHNSDDRSCGGHQGQWQGQRDSGRARDYIRLGETTMDQEIRSGEGL